MTTLSDKTIRELINSGAIGVDRYEDLEEQIQPSGFDVRVGHDYKHVDSETVFNTDQSGEPLVFQPGEFYIVHTIERISLPADIKGRIDGRSGIERAGLEFTSGPIDPGFEGVLRLGVYNRRNEVIRVEPGYDIAQVEFQKLDQPASIPYGAKSTSHFQNQEGIQNGVEDDVL